MSDAAAAEPAEIIRCDSCGEDVDYPTDVAKIVRSSGGSVRCEECGPPPEKPMIRIALTEVTKAELIKSLLHFRDTN